MTSILKNISVLIIIAFILICFYIIFNSILVHKYDESKLYNQNFSYNQSKYSYPKIYDNKLQIHTINVGQSDSKLIITPNNKTILVDTGHRNQNGYYVKQYLAKNNINRIDKIILTHNDWDHIGGTISLIINYKINPHKSIGTIYTNGIENTEKSDIFGINITRPTLTYFELEYGSKILMKDLEPLNKEHSFNYNNTSINVLNPPETEIKSERKLNQNSIVLRITYNETSYLITGDIQYDAEKNLVEDKNNIESDIYMASHHGSKTSNSNQFLNEVDPEISIISSSYKSQYNHPHNKVLSTLAKNNVRTYWTGTHGSIISESNGTSWNIKVQNNSSTKPKYIKHSNQINIPPHFGYSK